MCIISFMFASYRRSDRIIWVLRYDIYFVIYLWLEKGTNVTLVITSLLPVFPCISFTASSDVWVPRDANQTRGDSSNVRGPERGVAYSWWSDYKYCLDTHATSCYGRLDAQHRLTRKYFHFNPLLKIMITANLEALSVLSVAMKSMLSVHSVMWMVTVYVCRVRWQGLDSPRYKASERNSHQGDFVTPLSVQENPFLKGLEIIIMWMINCIYWDWLTASGYFPYIHFKLIIFSMNSQC